jgi:DNA-directed RNA polymerase specialized sigma subunit
MKTQKELEKLINESPMFLIDRVKDKELFVTEERRFLADLAEFLSLTRKDFRSIGFEIVSTAKACIESYKVENGVFLNYFNSALKRSLFTQKAKEEISETRSGLKLDQKTNQIIRRILQYIKINGEEPDESGFTDKIADALNIPLEKVIEAIMINRDLFVQSGNAPITNKDGKKDELLNLIADKTSPPDKALLEEVSVLTHIQAIDAAFQKQQERTKPLLSKLLTARLLKALDNIQLIEKVIPGISFIDKQLYIHYKKNRTVPTAKEIGESFGVMETSISRSINTFVEKINKNS